MSLSWQVLSSPFDVTVKPRTDLSRHYDDRKKFKKGRLLLENDGKSANNIMVDSRVVRRSIFASNGTNSLARYTSHSKGGGGGGSTVGFGRGGVVNNANSGKQQRQQNQQQQPHYQQQSSNGCILFDSRLIKGNIFANPIITVTKTIPNEEHLQEKETNRHQQPNTKSMKYRKQETPPPVKGRCHMTVQTDEQYFDDDLWERLLVSKPSVESQEDESQSATQEEDGIDGSNNDGNVSSTTDADADTANANVSANEQTINDANKEDGTEMKINAGNTCDNLVKFIIEEARENALNAMDESFDSVLTAPT